VKANHKGLGFSLTKEANETEDVLKDKRQEEKQKHQQKLILCS